MLKRSLLQPLAQALILVCVALVLYLQVGIATDIKTPPQDSEHNVNLMVQAEISIKKTWMSADGEVCVKTVREPNEAPATWKTRHQTRVTETMAMFPEI